MQIESAPHKNRMMLKACIQKLPVEIVSDVVFEDLASAFEPGGWGALTFQGTMSFLRSWRLVLGSRFLPAAAVLIAG